MKKLLPREKSALQRRQLIVEAAVQCFVEQGFHQTSIRDIAQVAGVSVGNLYNHFDSKAALIIELARWESGELQEIIAKLDDGGDPASVLARFVARLLDYWSDPVNAVLALEFSSEAARSSEIGTAFSKTRSEITCSLKALLTRGIKSGRFRSSLNVDEAPEFIVDIIEGLALRSGSSTKKARKAEKAELQLILDKYLLA